MFQVRCAHGFWIASDNGDLRCRNSDWLHVSIMGLLFPYFFQNFLTFGLGVSVKLALGLWLRLANAYLLCLLSTMHLPSLLHSHRALLSRYMMWSNKRCQI